MTLPKFIPHIISFDSLPSTNNELKNRLKTNDLSEFTTILTSHQTNGRGQQSNVWESADGLNLTFSVLLKPVFLEPALQFYLSKIVALALTDVLMKYVDELSIKWPNDIYVGEKKIAGILIENSLMGSCIDTCVVGIGLNVNQLSFQSSAPNPISLKHLTAANYDLKLLLDDLLSALDIRYQQLINDKRVLIDCHYHERLFRHTGIFTYRDELGEFKAKLTGVDESGFLQLTDDINQQRSYAFKEVEFVF